MNSDDADDDDFSAYGEIKQLCGWPVIWSN